MQIGRKLIHLESVDSTNNYIAKMIKTQGLSSGAVILADEQTSGRGQRDAEWLSEPGMNLTFSVFLDNVNLSVENQFELSKIAAVAIHDCLAKYGISSSIKWPNDSYIGDRKIAGMLIENSLVGSKLMKAVIGIGLNVNQTEFGRLNATSMKLISGKHYQLLETLYSLLDSLNTVYSEVKSGSRDIDADYLLHLYRINEMKRYRDEHGEFSGEICGVAETGKLQINRDGQIIEYSLKEIEFLD